MRWDSPVVLSIVGTISIHVLLIVVGDAVTVYNPRRASTPAPRIELFEIEVPPVVREPPPPVPMPPEPVPPEPTPPPPAVVARTQPRVAPRAATQPVADPPPTTAPVATSGGDQVVTLATAPPGATGVAVRVGPRPPGRIGRGGDGGGTGAGVGSGTGPEIAAPVSVATIKQRALPKGDHGYFGAGKDYPAEARQLGIEGPLRVRLVVDATGRVTSAVLLNKLGHGLDELALRRARQIEFEPARDTSDRPVASVVVWTFTMTLPQ